MISEQDMISLQDTMLAIAAQNYEQDTRAAELTEERQRRFDDDNLLAQAQAAAPQLLQKNRELAANARAKGRQKSRQDPPTITHIAKGVLTDDEKPATKENETSE